jgi:hypothetical protein
MEADFPAAHSMDSTWFAVDGKGQVAVFETGENGPLPGCFSPQEVYAGEVLGDVGGTGLDMADGIYVFDYEDPEGAGCFPAGLYIRTAQPRQPLHVDQLPPRLRKLVSRLKLVDVDFVQVEAIQPLEYTDCGFWQDFQAYLASDGVTIRPIPGEEGNFAKFLAAFRKECPKEFEQFRFEPPEPPPPRRGKGKKK